MARKIHRTFNTKEVGFAQAKDANTDIMDMQYVLSTRGIIRQSVLFQDASSTRCIIATSEQAGVLVLLQELPSLPNILQHICIKYLSSPQHMCIKKDPHPPVSPG